MRFKPIILGNIVSCTKSLVEAMDILRIPYGFDPAPFKNTEVAPINNPSPEESPSSDAQTATYGDEGAIGELNDAAAIASREAYVDALSEEYRNSLWREDDDDDDDEEDIPPPDDPPTYKDAGKEAAAAALVMRATPSVFGESEVIPDNVIAAIKTLWKDPGIQYCFSRANEFQLIDSTI